MGNAYLVHQLMPIGPERRVHPAQMPVGDVVDIGFQPNARIPDLGEDRFIDRFIDAEALQGGADARKAGAAFGLGTGNPFRVQVIIPFDFSHAAEIAQIAPDELLAVEAFGAPPYLNIIAFVVQYDHPALRNGGQVSFDPFRRPTVGVAHEEPAHLEPNRFGIHRRHGFENALRDPGKRIGIPGRRFHFVEQVHPVDVVGAVHTRLLLEEVLLDLRKKRIRRIQEGTAVPVVKTAPAADPGGVRFPGNHVGEFGRDMPGESRKHRRHAEFPFAAEDAFLQRGLAVDPALRERALPAVDIDHPLPRQVSGSREERADLFVGEAPLAPHLLPDGLLAGNGQRHVHAVERHPVDEPFPLFPRPPGHGVAESAVIQEEAYGHLGPGTDRFLHPRHHFRQLHGIEVVPAHVRQAVFLQVAVEAYGHRIGIVPPDENFGTFLNQFVGILRSFRLLEGDGCGFVSHDPAGEFPRGAFIGRPARKQQHGRQGYQ